MAYGIVLEFGKDVTKQQYDAVNEKLGLDPATASGNWPKGLKSHAGGTTPEGFCVFEVWDSKATQEAWMGGYGSLRRRSQRPQLNSRGRF